MADSINVINANGEVESVSPENLQVYLRSGYTLDTPELAEIRQEKEKYGGTSGELKAFGEEALNAPTFGLGHRLEESLGVDKEDILKRKLYNPNASTAGGIAGIVGASLLPGIGEAEGAAEGAGAIAGSGVEAASALGEGAGGLVEGATRRILSGIPKSGIVGSIADYAPTLAGGTANAAVQSAIYNAAQKIDETHLAGGNLEQGVENALATTPDAMKVGALTNIVLQGGGHLLAKGAQKSIDALHNFIRDEIIPRATSTAADVFAKASSSATGEPMENFSKYIGEEGAKGRSELLNRPKPMTNKELAESKDAFEKKATPVLQDVLDKGRELAYKKFGGILNDTKSELLEGVDPLLALNTATKFSDELHAAAQKLESNEPEFSKIMASRARTESDIYERKLLELQEKTKPQPFSIKPPQEELERVNKAWEEGEKKRIQLESEGIIDNYGNTKESNWERSINNNWIDENTSPKNARLMDDTDPGWHAYRNALMNSPKPEYRSGWRYGDLPESGISQNFSENKSESGVSIMGFHGEEPFSGASTYEMFNSGDKPKINISGWDANRQGSDGEPLLVAARKITDPSKTLIRDISAESVFDLMNETKKRMDSAFPFSIKHSFSEDNGAKVMRETTKNLRRSLEDTGTWGQWGEHQKAINGPVADFLALTGKGGAFRKQFLTESKYGVGAPELTVKGTSITNMVNKISTQRGQDQLRAIQAMTDAVQGMTEAYQGASKATGREIDNKYVQSLLDTQKNIEGVHSNLKEGAAKFGDSAKMRGLANAPFVTGANPEASSNSAMLGSVGGAALGATLGHVGLGGVGILAGARAIKKSLNNPLETLQTLAKIEKFNDTTSRKIQSGISSLLKKSEEISGKIYQESMPVIAYEESKKIPYKEKLNKMLSDNSDPISVSAKYHSGNNSTPLSDHAPKFSKSVAEHQSKIHNWLWNQFPKDKSQYPQIGGSKFSNYQPSKSEMDDYYEKELIAKKPMIAIELFKQGALSQQGVETLKSVWPKIYDQMKFFSIDSLGKINHDLTLKQKKQLSILVGNPIDDSQDPALLQLVQKNFEAQNQAKKQSSASSGNGLSKLSEDSKTASQRLQK